MAESMISMASALKVFWHNAGWNLVIGLGALWAGVLVASWRGAKPNHNLRG